MKEATLRLPIRTLATKTPLLAIAVFVVAAFLPEFGIDYYWQRQLILVAIFTLMCSGLNLSFGYAGELALGQVAVFASGAYVSAILYNHGHTDILLGFLVAVCLAAAAGLLSGIPGLRLSHWSLALVSFFLVLLIPSLTSVFSHETGGLQGLPGIIGPTLLGRKLGNSEFYMIAVLTTLVWMLVFRNLIVSRFGQSLRVLAASPTLALTLGCSVYRLRMQAYVLGALPAGLAGVLYTYLTGFISPDAFTLDLLITVLAATVVGGAKSVWGAPVGAALLVLGPLQVSSLQEYSTAVYGGFLILVAVAFSGGLAGIARTVQQKVIRARPDAPGQNELSEGTSENGALSIPGQRLVAKGIEKQFAGLRALTGVDLVVQPGTITAIIGPNGAGKTTLLNVISGLVRSDAGNIELAGRSLTGKGAHRISRLGVGRTFQTPIIPESMTVLEVVACGQLPRGRVGLLSAMFRPPKFWRARRIDERRAREALSFAGLGHLADHDANALPLGTRRLLEVVRSVAAEPNVMLLDEPAAGLDDDGLHELATLMRRTRDAGGTVVLVEHNVPFVMSIADQVFVMELGRVIASGPPAVVRADQRVIDSYLGRRGQGTVAADGGESLKT